MRFTVAEQKKQEKHNSFAGSSDNAMWKLVAEYLNVE